LQTLILSWLLQQVHPAYVQRMRIALYQPEIPGNVGAILRLSACFQVDVDIIEPTGFIFSDSRLRRAAMDYIDHVTFVRHPDWVTFRNQAKGRIVLLSSKATTRLSDFAFATDDILLMGQESAGVPDSVRAACGAQVRIPLHPEVRSLNVSVAAGIALAEALRQTGQLPA
jgi:tRNA (cytidine/uridine-2'-O-)-methyltransferase